MKGASTLFLKIVIAALGLAVLSACIFLLVAEFPEEARGYYPVFVGLSIAAIPFFAALSQTLKLLSYVDRNIAFSELSAKALRAIKRCAVSISVLFTLGLPYLFRMAQLDDAPGVALFGLVVIVASISIAIFAAVLEKLLRSAVEMKEENELTV